MKIAVCMKAVLDTSRGDAGAALGLGQGPEDRTIRTAANTIANPFDQVALEAALSLPLPGSREVTVLSTGPRAAAEPVIAEALRIGADRAFLLSDPAFAGSDTYATSRILASALRTTGPYDLILCGDRAVDGETAQVPAELSVWLDCPLVCHAEEIFLSEDRIGCVCSDGTEERRRTAPLPAVVSVTCGMRGIEHPLLPSLRSIRAARSKRIEILDRGRIGLSAQVCGTAGSPTRVIRTEAVRGTRVCRRTRDVREGIEELLDMLKKPVIRTDETAEAAYDPCGDVWVVCRLQKESDRINAPSEELLERTLCLLGTQRRGRIRPVLMAPDSVCAPHGWTDMLHIRAERDAAPDELGRLLADAARAAGPGMILAPANGAGRSFMPAAACRLGTGLTADCTDLSILPDGRLEQIRPAFGGSLIAHIVTSSLPQMATVRVLSPKAPDERILVVGGLGMGSKENFQKLYRIAEKLGAGVGATRAAVNAGYAPYRLQIGQSGRTVAPDLYLAVGVSGAVQHLAGFRRAGRVAAVNPDRRAPIFDHADLGIEATWQDLIGALSDVL